MVGAGELAQAPCGLLVEDVDGCEARMGRLGSGARLLDAAGRRCRRQRTRATTTTFELRSACGIGRGQAGQQHDLRLARACRGRLDRGGRGLCVLGFELLVLCRRASGRRAARSRAVVGERRIPRPTAARTPTMARMRIGGDSVVVTSWLLIGTQRPKLYPLRRGIVPTIAESNRGPLGTAARAITCTCHAGATCVESRRAAAAAAGSSRSGDSRVPRGRA